MVEKGTGRRPAALDGPDLPACAEHLWDWFCELSSRRGGGMNGPAPLTYAEVGAWMRLTGMTPTPWEVHAILELDNDYLKQAAQSSENKD